MHGEWACTKTGGFILIIISAASWKAISKGIQLCLLFVCVHPANDLLSQSMDSVLGDSELKTELYGVRKVA